MTKALRCAIYTRKSSDEGLEQSFNSLDAQREACEAYIKSQAHEGWQLIKKHYDDGGFSGGSMERPGLQILMQDIDAGRIDIVVVYKVDRLTRSLADFAKIVELLDRKGTSFVSVTQPFNTTTSMGRLTLNVLLSFAQFEREVTGERIRDKIAASKKKGMWMGGYPSLGYDVVNRELVVNEAEAKTVRQIYERYLALGTVKALAAELDKLGITSKRWKTAAGKPIGGNRFSRGALYHLLRNRLYIGEITHKGQTYKGTHPPLVARDLWDKVQSVLAEHRHERRTRKSGISAHRLTGLIFDDRGNRMSPSHANKAGRRYLYYVSQSVLQNRAADAGSIRRIPAPPLDQLVADRLRRVFGSAAAAADKTDQPAHAAIQRVVVARDRVQLILDPKVVGAAEAFRHRLPPSDAITETDDTVTVNVATRLTAYGGRKLIEGPNGQPAADDGYYDLPLMKALATAYAWREQLTSGAVTSLSELGKRSGCDESRVRHLLPLAFMAPALVAGVLNGKQPRHVTVDRLVKLEIPYSWERQRRLLAFG